MSTCDASPVPPRRPITSRGAAAARDLASAGLEDAALQLAEPDPSWPARFESERRRIQPLIPGGEIHHIGSTAVPGLLAKPVIDLMVLTANVDGPIPALTGAGGYQFPEAFNAELGRRRWLCRPSAAHRTHHLHLVEQRPALDRHLRFRDRLREDPTLRDEYAAVKRELAARFRDDREAYTEAKSAFIQRHES